MSPFLRAIRLGIRSGRRNGQWKLAAFFLIYFVVLGFFAGAEHESVSSIQTVLSLLAFGAVMSIMLLAVAIAVLLVRDGCRLLRRTRRLGHRLSR